MYNGYTEPQEKIEARKRRILGKSAAGKASPPQDNRKLLDPSSWSLHRQVVMMLILYPAGFILGAALGQLIQALWR